jgi:putative ABC transport system permease protein
MVNVRFVRSQIACSKRQSSLFVLCVILSMVTLVSLGSFSHSVQKSLLRDARSLHAGDIIVRSHEALPPTLSSQLELLTRQKTIESARFYEFYSVVRTASGNASLLANLKVVEPGYPFYGTVELASKRPFAAALTPGTAIVEQGVLDRLHLTLGDTLLVGSARLTISDVVLAEPDRPVNFFALGPRIFIAAADLDSLELLGKGSRVEYVALVKVRQEKRLAETVAKLAAAAPSDAVQVNTYRNADSRVKRFFDNLLFFLDLIGIFTLLLAGIGIQSTLSALLLEQQETIAIIKALGSKSRFIIGHYLALVLVLGVAGTAIGLALSLALQDFLPILFRGLIPARVELTVSAGAIVEGAVTGLVTVLIFTALPLSRLRSIRPALIFGKAEPDVPQRRSTMAIASVGALFFAALILLKIREPATAGYFMLGCALLVLVAFLGATLLLKRLMKWRAQDLLLRQAIRGLFRPRNATRAIMVTLTAALAVIFAIRLVEMNLDASFVRSFPPDAPNLFFIDIQPGQKAEFTRTLGKEASYYPIVRGSVVAVNGSDIDRETERHKRGDNLAREFNLTYRDGLLPDERILKGERLFRADWSEPQVSVLDTVLKMEPMRLGDRITFRVQGLPITARIASIRTRTEAPLQPYFYFVFQQKELADAPQTIFCALRVEKKEVAELQNRMVARFPNLSVIDLTETASVFGRIMAKLSMIVRFFTSFSIAAGVLIIVSSTFATRYARIQEAVYFTILGGRRRFILAVFGVESLILGAASALFALIIAQSASFFLCWKVLALSYRPFAGESLLLVGETTLLVLGTGVGAALPILFQRPAPFLRALGDE